MNLSGVEDQTWINLKTGIVAIPSDHCGFLVVFDFSPNGRPILSRTPPPAPIAVCPVSVAQQECVDTTIAATGSDVAGHAKVWVVRHRHLPGNATQLESDLDSLVNESVDIGRLRYFTFVAVELLGKDEAGWPLDMLGFLPDHAFPYLDQPKKCRTLFCDSIYGV